MQTYMVLKIEADVVYLGNTDGNLKKLSMECFSYSPKEGDQVLVYSQGKTSLVTKGTEETTPEGNKWVKSSLLQGILDLFLETLAVHNNHLGDIKKIFSQLLITLFMAWSLLGVIVIEILLLLESVIVFVYRLLIGGLRAIRLASRIQNWFDNREKKAALRRQAEEVQAKKALRQMTEEVESLVSSEMTSFSESTSLLMTSEEQSLH
ncbi:hypothetical protein [Streptococcus saliviloxodontae]|nr:hypothetical protein [Streptococcus saliviloxodontae]